MEPLLPVFLKLYGRKALLVGGGRVAATKLESLLRTGASMTVVAPEVREDICLPGVEIRRRPFRPDDLDNVWFVVTAATPDVNRQVEAAADARRIFVNAADDPLAATAFLGAVIRRADIAVAISTSGRAPALAALLRSGSSTSSMEAITRPTGMRSAPKPPAWSRCRTKKRSGAPSSGSSDATSNIS